MQSVPLNTPANTPPIAPPSLQQSMLASRRNAMSSLLSVKQKPRLNADCREYSEVVRETDVMSIPDVHGDIVALKKSLRGLGLTDSSDSWIGGDNVAVFLGDYIDRGNANLEVLDYIVKLKAEAEAAGGRIDLILGNHESMMLGAIRDKMHYRKYWLLPENGGGKVFEEVRNRYQLKSDQEVWDKLEELFAPQGKYYELTKSLKLVSQVDDVLYVHGGIDVEWAKIIKDEGVEGVNRRWSQAYEDLKKGQGAGFEKVAGEKGPLWIRYKGGIKNFSAYQVAVIARCLKDRGINAVVLGHDVMDFGPMLDERFEREGIKLIASDVAMSIGYNERASSEGGIKIDRQGNIEGRSEWGIQELHKEKASTSKAA